MRAIHQHHFLAHLGMKSKWGDTNMVVTKNRVVHQVTNVYLNLLEVCFGEELFAERHARSV